MRILSEAADYVVCVKAPGELSEESANGADGLVTLLRDFFAGKSEPSEIFPVHRLDRGVGGIMVYARTKRGAAALSAAVQKNELVKEYLAAVYGTPEKSGVLTDLLWHDRQKNKTFVVKRERKGVKPASLEYRVLARKEDRSLCAIRLHTGRTHQIRVQFASRKHPLLGDGKYGAKDNLPLALHAFRLTFPDPASGKKQIFTALPETLGGFERADFSL